MVLFTLSFVNLSHAQNLSVGFSAGHVSPVMQESFGESGSVSFYHGHSGAPPSIPSNANFGKGSNANLILGYQFNKHVQARIIAGFLRGGEANVMTDGLTSYYDNSGAYITAPYHSFHKWSKSSELQLIPAFKFSVGNIVKPYFQIGAGMNLFNFMKESSGDFGVSKESTHSGGSTYTLISSLGIEVNFHSHLTILFDNSFEYVNWKPAHYVQTEWMEYGVDKLNGTPQELKDREYIYHFVNFQAGLIYVFARKTKPAANAAQ